MSEMQITESAELFSDSLKRAASAARLLAKKTKSKHWYALALSFDGMRANGENLYKRPVPSRQDVLALVNNMVAKDTMH